MGVSTAVAYQTLDTKAAFYFMSICKVNDRTVIIRMDSAVSPAFADGTEFCLGPVSIHVGIENKF